MQSISANLNIMIKAANLDIKPIFGPALDGDIKFSLADISLITKSLDWYPTKTIQEWLQQKLCEK